MSSDPAMESYIPEASSNEGAGERNQNLPGMGGIYNSRNLQTYHYAGNNPLKYTDPSGRASTVDPGGTKQPNWIPPDDSKSFWNQVLVAMGAGVAGGPVSMALYGAALRGELPHGGVIDNNHPTVGKALASGLSDSNTSLNQKIINEVNSGTTSSKDSHGFSLKTDLGKALGKVNYTYDTTENDDGTKTITVTVTDNFDFNQEKNTTRGSLGETVTGIGRDANIVDNTEDGPQIRITYTITLDADGNVVEPEE